MEEYEKGKLDKLENKLYSRKSKNILDSGISDIAMPETPTVDENWQEEPGLGKFDSLVSRVAQTASKKQSFAKKFFVGAVAFFLVSLAVAAFVFLGGTNLVSSKNVDVVVVGPASIAAGQAVSLDVGVLNGNSSDFESATLSVEYPQGTRSSEDLSKDLTNQRFDLGPVKSGQTVHNTLQAVFFGDKESVKELKFTVEYKVKNSRATFYKEKLYDLSISSAPIIVTSTYPKEVNSGQDIEFKIEVASNSNEVLSDLLLSINYPFGFNFMSASPSASFGNNIWSLPKLKQGEKTTITIRGRVVGQDNEERVFKIVAGNKSADDERQISVPLASADESITLKKPFVGLDLLLNGSDKDISAPGGSNVSGQIKIINNLTDKLFNISAVASLSGAALDQSKVTASQNGFFQSANNTISWDQSSVSEFKQFDPGEDKTLYFSLSPLPYDKIQRNNKPEINMTITVKGQRTLDSGSTETVTSVETRTITLSTDIALTAKSARSFGGIATSGLVPPQVNNPTTYNIVWSIKNSFNQAGNVEVSTALPLYVEWVGSVSPSSESITFDETSRRVTWHVGTVLANTGFTSGEKTATFQIRLLPSVSQVGTAPELIGASSLSGLDRITGGNIETSAAPVTTLFNTDSTYRMGDEKVVQ